MGAECWLEGVSCHVAFPTDRWENSGHVLSVHHSMLVEASSAGLRVHSEVIDSTLHRNLIPWRSNFEDVRSFFVSVTHWHDLFSKYRSLELPMQVRLILRAGMGYFLDMRGHL